MKNGSFWGYVLLFGGSDGAPRGPRVLIWGPWYRMGMGWLLGGLTLDFRPTLPVVVNRVSNELRVRLYVLCTITSKPPNPRLKIYLIHIHCDIWPYGGQKIWFQPAVLLPFRAFWVVNQRKLILLAVNLQGSYLYLYRTELQKLHEVWKDFFKSYNLRPSATF